MRYTEEEKKMRLEDWQMSGKSARDYAKETGINQQTFARWTKPKTRNGECFVEVPALAPTPERDSREILIEKGEIKVHIPLSIGSDELRMIFGILGGAL
jgi:transposase-like protein